jgi:hypothetical protein
MKFELIKEFATRVTYENYSLIFPNGVSYVGYFKGVDTPENLKNNHWAFVLSNKTECIINGNLILSIH